MEPDILSLVNIYEEVETLIQDGNTNKSIVLIKSLFDHEQKNATLSRLVQFFSICKDLKSAKSVAFYASKELEKWISVCQDESEVEEELKTEVMPVAIASHSITASNLIKSYELNKAPNRSLKSFILDLIAQDRLKEATSWTCKLLMQDEFGFDDLVLPMLAENKRNLVEEYLKGSKTLQLEMIKLLDLWIQPDFGIIEFLQEKNIHQARGEILRPKVLIKLLTRWLKLFMKIEPSSEQGQKVCPNLHRQKSLNHLKYLLYRHYVEEQSTVETAQELILKAVGDDRFLQEQLIDILANVHGDRDSAKQWAKLYNVQHEAINSHNNQESSAGEIQSEEYEDWDNAIQPTQYFVSKKSPAKQLWYDLKLSSDKITFVNSCDLLKSCEEHIMSCDILGIDAEWAPCFTGVKYLPVALLQIATRESAFLVDVAYFSKSSKNVEAFCKFITKVFSTRDVLKIGFGVGEDLRKLAEVFPTLSVILISPTRVMDLCSSVKVLESLYPKVFNFPEEALNDVGVDMPSSKKETGLSKLTLRCLGRPLDKCEQMSDWERRPLRPSQITYAALDAFVLVELYDFIHEKMGLEGIEHNLETISNVQNKKQFKKRIASDPVPKGVNVSQCKGANKIERAQIKPHEFKVVCDNMLQGLGRQLRCCGVDVKILNNFDDHEVAAEVANTDGRVLLTSGAPYQYLASQVPVGECFDVPCGLKAKDQAAIVLEHFNVKVTVQDIFSRCQICNGNKYLKVMPEVMKQCMKRKQEMLKGPVSRADVVDGTSSIPWNEIQSTTSAGRGKQFGCKTTFPGNSNIATTFYQSSSAGRGKAIRWDNQCHSSGVSSVDNFPGRSKISHDAASDCDDDLDDILVFQKDAPYERRDDTEFVPIGSSTNISSQKLTCDSEVKVLIKNLKSSQINNSSDDMFGDDQPVTVKSEICIGIKQENQNKPRLAKTSETKDNDCLHSGGKDKVIPYIINPLSLCSHGFVDITNVTIVTSKPESDSPSNDGSSPTDALITPLLCEQVPVQILDRITVFYSCVKCGKVYWEGKHFSAVLDQFSRILCEE